MSRRDSVLLLLPRQTALFNQSFLNSDKTFKCTDLNLSLSHPSRCVNGFLLYLSLPLVLPSHQPLPLFTIPHTRMLHHGIHSPLQTNHHWFHHLTPLHSTPASHSPPPTPPLRKTPPPCMVELAAPPPPPHHHHHTILTCTHDFFFTHAHLRGGRGTSEWDQEPWWRDQEGVQCNAHRCPRAHCAG